MAARCCVLGWVLWCSIQNLAQASDATAADKPNAPRVSGKADTSPGPSVIPAIPLILPPAASGSGAAKETPVPPLEPGVTAPDFKARDLGGREVRLSDFTNQVVVLDFWATWCGPCLQSLPHTQLIAKRYRDRGVVVLANCTADTRVNFEKFVKANQGQYPDLRFTCDLHDRGTADYEERVSKKLYRVSGIPTQFVIGRDGKIVSVIVGFDEADHRLEEALAGLGVRANAIE